MNSDVLVIAEHFQGRLTDITFELVGKGRELARALGGKLRVLLLGHGVQALAGGLGAADVVWIADRPEFQEFVPEAYAAGLAAVLKDHQPRMVLLGSTSVGMDLLGFVSARAGFPCFDNCTGMEVRGARVMARCQIYGGKVYAEVPLPEATTLVAVVPGTFAAEAGRSGGKPEIQAIELPAPLPQARTTFRKMLEPPPGDVDITKARVLVAVGRGIQNADNLPLANELAEVLGGAVCASRPVVDQGWLPSTRQVGKSGMTVKPKLYLALGISGAPEHVEGMKQSEMILAVNTDPKAPIFDIAHYGVVADALDVVPLLVEEVRRQALKKAS